MFLSRRMWRQFFPLAMAVTLLCALMYLGFQQMYRMNLNDPQIQIAQDVKTALNGGADPKSLISSGNQIDMGNSLATFMIIYDNQKKPVVSSVQLNGKLPNIPDSVLDYVNKNGGTRVTWQPDKNVRIAAVVEKTKNNYVLVGRSMKEVENRIAIMGIQMAIAWLAIIILVYGSVLIVSQRHRQDTHTDKE